MLKSNPKVTIWGLWERMYPFHSTNNVQNDGLSGSFSGGGGDSENTGGDGGRDKGNRDGGGGGGGGESGQDG